MDIKVMLQMHVLRLKIRYVIMAYLVMSWISLYFFESSHPWIFESWSTYHIAEMYMLAGGLKEIRLEQSDLMLATFLLRLWIVYARGPSFSPTCCPLLTTFLSRYYINRFHKVFIVLYFHEYSVHLTLWLTLFGLGLWFIILDSQW